jgi:probable HAF family extracellular repeat protein
MKLKSLALTLGVAMLCMSSAFAQYSYQTINYPDDTFTQLLGINNNNFIAGYHGANPNMGFTYDYSTSTFTNENYPKSQQTQVIGINNDPFKTSGFYIEHGKTIGFTDFEGTFTSVAYPKKPFNQLLSQNDFGQAAGYYSSNAAGTLPDVPYVYDEFGGVFEVYTIPGAVGGAQATGINNAGSVCGFYIDGAAVSHGWLQVQGHFTVLNYPGSTGTSASGLNNKGSVVGFWTDNSGGTHGFVYNVTAATFTNVDDPNGVGNTLVNGINDDGTLVGFYGPSACTTGTCNGFVAMPTE